MTTDQKQERQISMFGEVGSARSGVDRFGHSNRDGVPAELRGDKAIRVFREMRRSDPVVGALIMAIKMIVRTVPWNAERGVGADEGDTEAEDARLFLEQCMSDMSHPWAEFIDDSLDAVWAGFTAPEVVYKQRLGPTPEGSDAATSDHDDGLVGWRKIAYRDPTGVVRWQIDEHGGIGGYFHRVEGQDEVFIPIDKVILFRASREGNDPNGYSWLTNAHEPWQYKRKHQWLEAIGAERAGLGLPVVQMPLGASTAEGSTDITRARALVRGIRNDSYAGVVIPPPMGKEEYQRWVLRLETAGQSVAGTNSDVIIKRYVSEIMTSVLAQFLVQGMSPNGSYSMSKDHRDLWQMAVSGLVQTWAELMNRFMVKPLFRFNQSAFPDSKKWPRLVPGDIAQYDLTKVVDYVTKLFTAGLIDVSDDDRNRLRDMVGWPNETQEQIKEREEAEAEAEAQAEEMRQQLMNPAPDPNAQQNPNDKPDPNANKADPKAVKPAPVKASEDWSELEHSIGKPVAEWTPDDAWAAAFALADKGA